ncbi:IclR family transcriptional regulator [Agromyces sp. GXS1127]|uniref:IclR family transcriptional regulator n=1 Tax=Agromyces sp. GXS1127 TaxID=3424181 RepID=UPI003D3174AD
MTDDVPRRGGRPAAGEPLLDRAFRLLGAFDDADGALTLSRLSERSGIPTSTTLRLAQRLVGLRALERRHDGTYTIGLRMLELAALAPRGHGLRAVALPHLEELHRVTGHHVQLAVRDGDAAVIIERLTARDAAPVLYSVGGRVPLCATSLGHVLLAYAPAPFRNAYLAREHVLEPEGEVIAAAALRSGIACVRLRGAVQFTRPLPTPATSVAAPIRDAPDEVVAALSVLGPGPGRISAALEETVIAAAHAVSRDLRASRSAA